MALRRRRAPESDAEESQPPKFQPQDTRDATRSLGAILAELGDRSFGWSIIVEQPTREQHRVLEIAEANSLRT